MKERLGLHKPKITKQLLELMHVREVTPADICPPHKQDALFTRYPDLMGDGSAIGPGDDGNCQSWRNHQGWWKELLKLDK